MKSVFEKNTVIQYPHATMEDMIEKIAKQYPNEPAYELYGKKTTYSAFVRRIETAAKAFVSAGIQRGDVVTICMPNVPQALDCFYALDRIGAVSNMIHPQSSQNEITYYLNLSESKMILVLDMFYEKVRSALKEVKQPVTVLVARMQTELYPHLALAYALKVGKNFLKYPDAEGDLLWADFLRRGKGAVLPESIFEEDHTAVILYSGGTSGVPKGICLTDLNFNACALEAREAIEEEFRVGLKMLSCMPLFHGFGLGINLHTVLIHGACCILMPTFNSRSYANMLKKKKPNFIAGVPTIFEALLHLPQLDGVDLSFLLGMFCGGDSLSVELKKKIDAFLKDHGASIQVREGYGLTECVTASCLTPKNIHREGSIGLPFPDTTYCIVSPNTDEELSRNTEGEIILTSPTLMKGYLNNEEETKKTLRVLKDGNTWLYTGDLGKMDEDGYIYFSQRIKRMIITNGYNVYPGQLENVIDSYEEVAYSCVIGVKDPRRMQRVRAYVVLKDGYEPNETTKEKILEQCRLGIASYAMPREVIFEKELPKTLVGKVAYRLLEEKANAEADQ